MNFLVISTMNGYTWGGSEELWYATVNEALSQGHKVDVVVFENSPIHPKLKELQKKIKVYYIGCRIPILPPLLKRLFFKIIRKSIDIQYNSRFEFLNEKNYDFVLLSQGGATDIIYYDDLLEYLLELKSQLYIVNHLVTDTMYLDDYLRPLIQKLFSSAKQVLFVSERNKSDFERVLLHSFKNSAIVKNPVNLDYPGIVKWPESQTESIAIVARIDTYHKGHDILLSVLRLPVWRARNYKLNIYGTGPNETYLKDLINYYELANKVEFKGHCSDIKEVWKHNKMLVLASRVEGFPLTIMEAMLCGRAVVTTNVGDSAVLIEEGINGWIAESPTITHVSAALEKAWHSRSNWEKAGVFAYEKAIKMTNPNPAITILKLIMHSQNH